jgi:hypothetical protein
MSDPDRPHKGSFAGKNAPYFSDRPPRPGDGLVTVIDQLAIDQRRTVLPVYFIFIGRPVPLVDYLAGPEPGVVIPTRFTPPWKPVALTDLPVDSNWSVEFVRSISERYQRVDGRRLVAAYNADIAGGRDHHTDDVLRRDVREGRQLLARQVGAWPWAVYGPNGRLPRRWWLDERAIVAWRRWVSSG